MDVTSNDHTAMVSRIAETGFGLSPVLGIKPIGLGLVNLTFRVTTLGATYALQRLHPVFGPHGAVAENTLAVCRALAEKGLPAPRVLLSPDGRPWVASDGIWRAVTWLPGRPAEVKDAARANRAAVFLGRFHRALNDPPPHLESLLPADYNRERVVSAADWEGLSTDYRDRPDCEPVAGDLDHGRDLASTLTGLSLITRAVVHGDPKLDNFLFDDRAK